MKNWKRERLERGLKEITSDKELRILLVAYDVIEKANKIANLEHRLDQMRHSQSYEVERFGELLP
jgi:uncharacterized protein YhaN